MAGGHRGISAVIQQRRDRNPSDGPGILSLCQEGEGILQHLLVRRQVPDESPDGRRGRDGEQGDVGARQGLRPGVHPGRHGDAALRRVPGLHRDPPGTLRGTGQ